MVSNFKNKRKKLKLATPKSLQTNVLKYDWMQSGQLLINHFKKVLTTLL